MLFPFVAAFLLAASPVRAQVTIEQVREEIDKALSSRPAPAAAPRAAAPSAFNPAMGVTLDAVGQHSRAGQGAFKFRSAEMNLEAPVDPRAKLYAVINGTPDAVEVEEAAFVTTSLPYNLTVRGGRYFANFGRLPKRHDHELPFVERLTSLDTFVAGESRTDGVEVTHLFRTPFFLQGTLGAGSALGSENARLVETVPAAQDGHKNGRPFSSFTYNARLLAYVPLGDDWGVDLGASAALTPRHYYIGGARADEGNNARLLSAADVTVRWEPLDQNVYRKAIWGTEIFRNNERRRTTALQNERKTAWGGFTYADWRFAASWSAGPFLDYAEDLDSRAKATRSVGATATFHLSDFQRVRLQVSRKRDNAGGRADGQVFVQYIASIGSHVHAFKDR